MPELPEVETVVRGLRNSVVGDVIEDVWLSGRRQPLKSPPEEITAVLEGARIAGVRRMGKHIVIDLDVSRAPSPARHHRKSAAAEGGLATHAHFVVHLGMTGRLTVGPPDAPLAKHTHLVARLKSGRELRFVDPRMFGKLAVVREPFETAGTEPLDIGFELFAGLFRKRQTPIKSALLNQKLLRGIGNIYADEALARAGIRPRRRAATLTRADLHRLFQSVQQVLNQAIAAGGSSVSDYVDAAGEPGFFQFQHRVYGREGEPCLACGTPIKRVVIAGRSSHYCPKCQK
jgi:formamidopyrimidine-DNA glycosylase